MGRIRTIKPELFMDEELGALSGDHTVLFAGLFTLADRSGRLEDRPSRIKAALFPYREVDVDGLLGDLDRARKVYRYEDSTGLACLLIPGFEKHQRPHPKEPVSGIPEPKTEDLRAWEIAGREKKRQAVKGSTVNPSGPVGREGKGREGVLGKEGGGVSETPPPPPSKQKRVFLPGKLEAPTDPPDTWSPEQFWVWAQFKREQAGLIREPPPRQEKLEDFWREVSDVRCAVRRLQAAFLNFGDDPKWQQARPALPFAAFITQWTHFAPREELALACP